MKGGGGLTFKPFHGFERCPPQPSERFGTIDQPHLAIDETLTLSVVRSSPKALFSLRADQAAREYDCHQSLAAHSLSLRPLLAGELRTPQGTAVQDFTGASTGVVFLESSPRIKEMFSLMHFCVLDGMEKSTTLSFPVLTSAAHLRGAALDQCIENFQELSVRIGWLKRAALEHAGIGRHAGHLNNILYDNRTDRLYMTDLDTCLLIDRDLRTEQRGPQLLRDLASDLVRNLSSLSYYSYSGRFLWLLENQKVNPFLPYLHGFFRDDLEETAINTHGRALLNAYHDFISPRREQLRAIAGQRTKAAGSGNFVHYRALLGEWITEHTLMLAPVLEECYQMLGKSSLRERRFTLPAVVEPERKARFSAGAAALHQAYATPRRGADSTIRTPSRD